MAEREQDAAGRERAGRSRQCRRDQPRPRHPDRDRPAELCGAAERRHERDPFTRRILECGSDSPGEARQRARSRFPETRFACNIKAYATFG
jgi:hypothetical protein